MAEAEEIKGRREKGRRFAFKPKVCHFCVEKSDINYKDFAKLRRYVSDRGRIEPRRRTGVCARHQRRLALAIKRARYLALLPYTPSHISRPGIIEAESSSLKEKQGAKADVST